jgi:hypothetical protein
MCKVEVRPVVLDGSPPGSLRVGTWSLPDNPSVPLEVEQLPVPPLTAEVPPLAPPATAAAAVGGLSDGGDGDLGLESRPHRSVESLGGLPSLFGVAGARPQYCRPAPPLMDFDEAEVALCWFIRSGCLVCLTVLFGCAVVCS